MKFLLTAITLLALAAVILFGLAAWNDAAAEKTTAQVQVIEARAQADRLAELTRAEVSERLLAARADSWQAFAFAVTPWLVIAVMSVFGAVSVIYLTSPRPPDRHRHIIERQVVYLPDSIEPVHHLPVHNEEAFTDERR